MTTEKPSTPMLEAFLRQIEEPKGRPWWGYFDWPLAILVFCLISSMSKDDSVGIAGLFVAWLVFFGVRILKRRQIERLTPVEKLEFERWKKLKRAKRLLRQRRLHSRIPESVLLELERAARTWQDARDSLHAVALSEPAFANEAYGVVDASMSAAVAAAEPVILRDAQHRSELTQMEEDADLMARLRVRIHHEEGRMRKYVAEPGSFEIDTPSNLRERLEAARKERAAAEAELDALL